MASNNLPKYFSSASLLSYLQCPYKFKLLYIDKVGALYKKTKPYQAVGDTIHKVLSEFFRITDLKERTLEKLISLLDIHWVSEGYSTKEQEAEFKHNAVYWLRNFYVNNDVSIIPLYTEEFFRVEIKSFFLTGKIDRIDDIGDGVEIIDYKTGGRVITEEELYSDLQMNIYALCCWEKYKLFPKIVSQIFLQHNQKISVAVSPQKLQDVKNQVIEIVEKIYSDEKFLPTKNNLCPYCDFLTICPEMGMGVKIVKEKELKDEFQEITKRLERTINDLFTLNKISLDISELVDSKKIISSIPEFVKGLGIVKKVAVYLYNEEDNEFVLQNEETMPNKSIKQNELFKVLGITTQKDLVSTILTKEQADCILKDFTLNDSLFLPMVAQERLLGFVLVSQKTDYSKFTNYDVSLLQNLVNHVSVSLNNALLYELAITDGLTGLFVQRYFMSRLAYEIQRVKRYNTVFSLLMIDIDFFKQVNDIYGHLAGNKVLKKLAKILVSNVRQTDIVCRYGGEEFVILLIECGKQWAEKIALRINEAVKNTVFEIDENKTINITVSIGVETYYPDATAEEIIDHADKALYVAKTTGRNKVVVYDKNFVT